MDFQEKTNKKYNSSSGFNPIKQDKDGIRAMRVVWSTKSLDAALNGLNEGKKLIANPFYENNTRLLKGDLVFERTPEEIEEWKKCAKDIIYFTNTYCKLMTPEGVKQIVLRDYQENYLKHLMNCKMSIMLSARQAGKTTTSAIYMLHYLLFNTDKNALILGNKLATAKDIIRKLKSIFYEVPYFLKPGIYKWNESEIALDNGCIATAEATTDKSGIGRTIHVCLMDEFAHVKPNILEEFYSNLLPVLTAAKGKAIITSTQNGYNLFYRLWQAAKSGESEYSPFEVTWDMIPEWDAEKKQWVKRDEEWHRLQVANYGSEEAFNAQFGTDFDVKTNTLIDTKILRKIEAKGIEFKRTELPGVSHSQYFYWNPEYDFTNIKNDYFIITTDISEGVSGDDTVFMFNRLTYNKEKNIVVPECTGYFKCNTVNADTATTILKEFCQTYLDINHYLISLEYNLYGELFAKYIIEKIEKDPENVHRFNEDVIMKYWNEEMTRYTLGKKITYKTKQYGTAMFKQYYERGEIINRSLQCINQISNFSDTKGNGTFAACFGHDDLVMAQLQMVFVMENPQYKALCQMFLSNIDTSELDQSYNPYGQDQNMFSEHNNSDTFSFPSDYISDSCSFMDPYSSLSIEQQEHNSLFSRLNKY